MVILWPFGLTMRLLVVGMGGLRTSTGVPTSVCFGFFEVAHGHARGRKARLRCYYF